MSNVADKFLIEDIEACSPLQVVQLYAVEYELMIHTRTTLVHTLSVTVQCSSARSRMWPYSCIGRGTSCYSSSVRDIDRSLISLRVRLYPINTHLLRYLAVHSGSYTGRTDLSKSLVLCVVHRARHRS